MKITISIACLICLLQAAAPAQKTLDSVPAEWQFTKQKLLLNRASIATVKKDTTKDGENAALARWDWFWSKRFDSKGDMRAYGKAMGAYYTRSDQRSGGPSCQTDCAFSCFQADWRYLGPEGLGTQNLGKVNYVWVNPSNPNHILLGADAGLWKTVNGGTDWENISDFCLPGVGIFCIAVNPGNLNVIYVSTGIGVGVTGGHNYGYGVYKTSDGGASWQKMNINASLGMEESMSKRIIIHPLNNNNIYVALGWGVYKSIDNGNTWGQLFGLAENPYKQILVDMELVPSSTQDEVYVSSQTHNIKECSPCDAACTSLVIPGQTYLSSDPPYCATRVTAKVWKFSSGFNMVNVSGQTDISASIPAYPNNADRVSLCITSGNLYVACGLDNTSSYATRLYKRVGITWSNIGSLNSLGHNAGSFDVSTQNNNVMYLGAVGMLKSTNGGSSFQSLNPGHDDTRYLGIYQSVSNGNDVLFFGTDGGISKTVNGGSSFTNLNGKNLQLTQFYGISNSEILGNLIYAGAQDNGVFDNKSQSWRVNVIGDAYESAVDVLNPSIAYTTNGGGNDFGPISKTTDGGASWNYFGCPAGENCQGRPLVVDKNNRLYVGDKNLWRWNATTNSWDQITFLNTGRPICSISMTDDGNTACIVYSDIFWGGTPSAYANRVFRITNLNSTPVTSDITAGLSGYMWASPTDAVIEPVAGNKIWVCFGNLDAGAKVFEYSTQSASWTNYGQGIPNIPTNSLAYLRGSNDLLFLGSDDGVYFRHDGSGQWQRFSCNLPHTIVSDLEINYKLNRLRAATYGRGIWETPIPKLFLSTCQVPATVMATVGGLPYPMTNNQAVIITAKTAPVVINYTGSCSGGDCCTPPGNAVSWTVYQKQIFPGLGSETSILSGNSNLINFNGTFSSGVFGLIKRNQYRIEIKQNCSGNDCGTFNMILNGS